jgi:phosphoribosylaminoimidazole-succinocarboxamide synthase
MLVRSGSVKDIFASDHSGELVFKFSDRYSIFDWGTMPDPIPGKGRALAKMGRTFFEQLKKAGILTHYLGAGNEADQFRVQKIEVPKATEAATFYGKQPEWALIPLEVIYRWGVPRGSSLLKRQAGASEGSVFFEGQEFEKPMIEFTTKLERLDRALSWDEARHLAALNPTEWETLIKTTGQIAVLIRSFCESKGLKLWDGKLEFGFGSRLRSPDLVGAREIILVDTIGLDEMRLTYEGKPLSKEILRQFYIESNWVRGLQAAKAQDPVRFKEICVDELHLTPGHLPGEVMDAVSRLYQTVADLLAGELSLSEGHESIRKAFGALEAR